VSLNRVALIGRLVRDPELRTTNTGKRVVEASIAVDKRIKPQGDGLTADFFRVKAWNQQADYLSSYGGKGRLLAVDGRLETRKYVDKDGNNREAVEIVADHVSLLERPAEGQGNDRAPSGGQAGGQNPPYDGSGRGYQRPAANPARGNVRSADEHNLYVNE
jgi:single-strand DNA-binding protein